LQGFWSCRFTALLSPKILEQRIGDGFESQFLSANIERTREPILTFVPITQQGSIPSLG
jgi:hypothetical protein